MSLFIKYAGMLAIPCLLVIAIAYMIKQRDRNAVFLGLGIIIMSVGFLLQRFVPAAQLTLDDSGNMIASGTPVLWTIGALFTSLGLIVTTIAFGLTTFQHRKS